uniref:Uncharacterized protein LOC111117929 n=1 Tax=Crassostrea virginica TaxID=6565 RepID=A0A8B8CCK5_CRAVI|nr:uncharacterized protein LOC111117929 [Crassostrea virginica]
MNISSGNMKTYTYIFYVFAISVIRMLETNVSNGSKIYYVEEDLLKTCTSTCGTVQCSFNSYCGDDGRCLYCSDEKCRSRSSGCELFCEVTKREKNETPVMFDVRENRMVDYDTLLVLCCVFAVVILLLICILVAVIRGKLPLKFFPNVKQSIKEDIERSGHITNCSDAGNQTSALLVSGGTESHKEEDSNNSVDTRIE